MRLGCLLLLMCCALNPGTASAQPLMALPQQLAAQRALVTELRVARQQVDAALKVRKQRLEAWQQAVAARDAAAALLAHKKRAGDSAGLEAAQRQTFALDEVAVRARTVLAAAEADVARGGAKLLALYDALLVERRRTVDGASAAARPAAVQAYRDLAAQRDVVRQALLPVLADVSAAPAAQHADLDPRADDDVETLLEKADLARDLEQRLIRQMDAVRHRILELEEEQSVAKDVVGMVGRSALFDEEDRRLLVVRTETTTRPANGTPPPALAGGGGARSDGDDNAAEGGAPSAGFDSDPVADSSSGGAPPPAAPSDGFSSAPSLVSSTSVLRSEQALAVPATDVGMRGLLSSSTSVSSLKALEKKLKADAARASDKAKRLRVEAERRQ